MTIMLPMAVVIIVFCKFTLRKGDKELLKLSSIIPIASGDFRAKPALQRPADFASKKMKDTDCEQRRARRMGSVARHTRCEISCREW